MPPEQLLHRLYHQEQLRLFEPRSLCFGCSCSRERTVTMLRTLGREEVEATLAQRNGEIEVICEFCAEPYLFDRIDAEHLLRMLCSSSTGVMPPAGCAGQDAGLLGAP